MMLRFGICGLLVACCMTTAVEAQSGCARRNDDHTGCKLTGRFDDGQHTCVEVEPTECPQGTFVAEGSVCVHIEDNVLFTCKSGMWTVESRLSEHSLVKRSWQLVAAAAAGILCFFFCDDSPTIVYVTNKPPTIKCPGNMEKTAREGETDTEVTWSTPKASDPEGRSVTVERIFGKDPGSSFPEGETQIGYRARDDGGASSYCWFTVTVNVIQCYPKPPYIDDGSKSCSHPRENIYGTACTYTCDEGYEIQGGSATVKCQETATWTGAFPTCQPVSCGKPAAIVAGTLSCPQGHVFPELCYVTCDPGYRQPSGAPFVRCMKDRTWTTVQPCRDVEAPKFPNGCPYNQRMYSGPLESPVAVNWSDPDVTDNSASSVTLTSDVIKGTLLDPGFHIIRITASDLAGNKVSCNFVVTVEVRNCLPPSTPSNGHMTCSRGYVEGSECTVTCNKGYELQDNSTLTCLETELWNSVEPTCEAVLCPTSLPSVEHGYFVCANGYQYPAVCLLECDSTFDLQGQANVQCQENATWSQPGTCIDNYPPTFPNGCTDNVEVFASKLGQQTAVNWTSPAVSDNSGKGVTLQSDIPSGSSFLPGVTSVTYTATDVSGNTRSCRFTVTVTTLSCGSPSQNSSNNFMTYTCPSGYLYGAGCTLACTYGFPLNGADSITCEQDNSTYPPTMTWRWDATLGQPECIETNCTVLPAPLHGALACYQGNFGKECLMSCNDAWDVPAATDGRFTCPNDRGIWTPASVPDCIVRYRPGRMRMLSDLYYYTGSCNMSLEALKQNFITRIQSSQWSSACASTPSCVAENIEVTCGQDSRRKKRSTMEQLRNRRAVSSYYVRVTFEIVVEYDEGTKTPQDAYADYVAIKDAIYAKLQSDAASGHFDMDSLTTDEYGFGYPIVATDCPPGTLFQNKATTTRFSCAGCYKGNFLAINSTACQQCPVGSYSEVDTATSCTPCPPGMSTATAGSSSSADCKEVCTAGHFSHDGFVPCLPCPPGQYQSRDRATTCDLCTASTWTDGGASGLENCVATDAHLSKNTSLTAHATGPLSSLTLTSFLHMSDVAVASVAFTFQDSSFDPLDVHMYTHSNLSSQVPGNSSTSVSLLSEPNVWSRLVLTVDPNSGGISITYRGSTILTHTKSASTSAPSTVITTTAADGKVIVSGLYADGTLPDSAGSRTVPSTECNGESVTNLLTWTISPKLLQSPSVCDAVDECESSPCSSHGLCENQLAGFQCRCQDGWSGSTCNQPPDACYQHQCQNGATCVPGQNSYDCLCPSEYSGIHCHLLKVHGGFGEWSPWGNCSATCEGQQQRQRLCNNPAPLNGGNDCVGQDTQTLACGQAHCPVDGEWGLWAQWTPCSTSCGGGERQRQRLCDSPAPQHGGDSCDGSALETEACNTNKCPVHGGWGGWEGWTQCSVTCGNGIRSRARSCDSPAAAYGGDPCQGTATESEACNEQQCPVCSRLRRPVGTILRCEEQTSPYLKTCNLTCARGFASTTVFPQYTCGEETGHLWNGQIDHASPVILPSCSMTTAIEVPASGVGVRMAQSVPMNTGCDVNTDAVRAGVEQNMAQLPCVSVGCTTTVSTECIGQSTAGQSRRKRSTGTLGVIFHLAMNFGDSTVFNESEQTALEEYARLLALVDQSALLVAVNQTLSFFSVTVDGQAIQPDVTSVTHNASLLCPSGSTDISFYCVECPAGSKEENGQCVLCPVGQYQDEAGSTSCKLCPVGFSWDLPGAADISQCVFPFDGNVPAFAHDSKEGEDVALIVGVVVAVVLVIGIVGVVSALIILKKKSTWANYRRPSSALSAKVHPSLDYSRPVSPLSDESIFTLWTSQSEGKSLPPIETKA